MTWFWRAEEDTHTLQPHRLRWEERADRAELQGEGQIQIPLCPDLQVRVLRPRRWLWGRSINLHKVMNFLFLFFFLNSRKKTTRQFVRIHTIQSSKNRLDPGLDFRTWLKEHYAVLEKPYFFLSCSQRETLSEEKVAGSAAKKQSKNKTKLCCASRSVC